MDRRKACLTVVLALLAAIPLGAWPEEAAPAPSAVDAEEKAAFKAAGEALQKGPLDVPLAGEARLALPQGFAYIPRQEGARLMRAMGNTAGDAFLGLVVPRSKDNTFSFYELSYEPAGFIKDDDAKDWKADELLQQLRDGTAEGNKRRAAMGIPEMEVTGWLEAPHYNADRHQLVWSIASRSKGAPAEESDGVNYRTLVLGREGYFAMTLVTDKAHLDELRAPTATLLDRLTFDPGKQYANFNASTDHVAEFGLAALVAGVAAKKLGLLALAVAFVLKFAKIIALAVAGFVWAVRKKLGWARKNAPVPATVPPEPPPPAAAAAQPAVPDNKG